MGSIPAGNGLGDLACHRLGFVHVLDAVGLIADYFMKIGQIASDLLTNVWYFLQYNVSYSLQLSVRQVDAVSYKLACLLLFVIAHEILS